MSRAQSALTDEQRAIQETARRFAADRLAPGYQQRDKPGTFDRGLLRQMGALGLIGVDLPEEHGGLAAPGVTAGLVIEEIASADLGISYVQLLGSLMAASSPGTARQTWRSTGSRISSRARCWWVSD